MEIQPLVKMQRDPVLGGALLALLSFGSGAYLIGISSVDESLDYGRSLPFFCLGLFLVFISIPIFVYRSERIGGFLEDPENQDRSLFGNPSISGSSFLSTGLVITILGIEGLRSVTYMCSVYGCQNPYIPSFGYNWIQIYIGITLISIGAILLLRARPKYSTIETTLILEMD